jgi:hypothetical protein
MLKNQGLEVAPWIVERIFKLSEHICTGQKPGKSC